MFTLADHFFQMEGLERAEDPFLEGYTSLGFLAAKTRAINLTDAVGRDPADIRLTASLFVDPFADLDSYLRRAERYAGFGVDLINVGPLPGNPDPVGFVTRLDDEVIPRLADMPRPR